MGQQRYEPLTPKEYNRVCSLISRLTSGDATPEDLVLANKEFTEYKDTLPELFMRPMDIGNYSYIVHNYPYKWYHQVAHNIHRICSKTDGWVKPNFYLLTKHPSDISSGNFPLVDFRIEVKMERRFNQGFHKLLHEKIFNTEDVKAMKQFWKRTPKLIPAFHPSEIQETE